MRRLTLSILVTICFFTILTAVFFGEGGYLSLNIQVSGLPVDQRTVVLSTWGIPNFSNDFLENPPNMLSDFAGNAYYTQPSSKGIARLEPLRSLVNEWSTPIDNSTVTPTGIAFDDIGNIYFASNVTNKIGRLDPGTGLLTEWSILTDSSNNGTISIASDLATGSVFFVNSGNYKIGRLDPTSSSITEWIPINTSKNIGFRDIVFDPDNEIVFSLEDNGHVITGLDIGSNTFTEWHLANNSSDVSDLVLGFNEIFFSDRGTNSIGRLDFATDLITKWSIPKDNSTSGLTSVAFDSSTGGLYFANDETNKIGRLNPVTGEITEWSIGTKPLAITATPGGNLFFIDDMGRIGRLG